MSNRIEAVQAQNEPIAKSTANELNLSYILEQIARIQLETAYLNEAIEKLSMMGDAKESGPGFPPDIQGQAKANAIRDIVQCRETTNQQMLRFYERLYDDWRADHRKSEACAPTPPSDQVFFDALQLAIEKQSISASLLQMALGLGYAPANRLIERMEQQGFIGAFDPATKQRRVFITHEELAALKNNA